MSLFTDRQLREMKRNGFLVVDDAVDEETVRAARESFWDGAPFERDDYGALVDAPERFENAWEYIEDPEPFAAINDQLFPYAEELAGEGTIEHPGDSIQVTPRFPNGEVRESREKPPLARERGHIDGYGPAFDANHEVSYYTVMASVYLDRVEPRGGGFILWPGSHWYAADYYDDHHLESLVDNASLPAYRDGEWDRCEYLAHQYDPLEIHGDAGTTVFWHQNLLHCGGRHNSPYVRLSTIQRFTRPDAEEIKRDAYASPFKYWEGMDGVELV
jgi:ectoine hydroxylase-related dioxygenase (phytanoyl-CoA dioxygenase family)